MSKQYLIVSEQVGNFLENKSYKTPREKVAFMASIQEAERRAEDPLVLSDGDYDIIMRILNGEEFVVDTGKFYINVGAPINREEFLCTVEVTYDAEGNRLIEWGLDTLDNAFLFREQDWETLVPEGYRSDIFKVMERLAYLRKEEKEESFSPFNPPVVEEVDDEVYSYKEGTSDEDTSENTHLSEEGATSLLDQEIIL